MRIPHTHSRSGGFSIVELMVAVVVGMIAVIFATRLLVTSEQQKSAAVGGSDSMQNGMLAMFQINTDAAQAGWGINDALINGCNTLMQDTEGFQLAPATRNGAAITPLTPVVIQNNGNRSDVITLYSGSAMSGVGNVGVGAAYAGGPAITINLNTPFNFLQGDVLLVAPEPAGGDCSLAQLDSTPANNVLSITSNASSRYNAGTLLGGNYTSGQARVFNLGQPQKLSFHTWSVTNGVLLLRATDLAGTSRNPQTVIDNVVAIKAQYGFDTRTPAALAADPRLQVNQWSANMINADGDGETGGAGDYQRVASIRLAVIARSSVVEKPDPGTGTCSATTAALTVFSNAAPAGVAAVPVAVALDVPNDPVSWTCYRYRAFETIVPIRNSGWRP